MVHWVIPLRDESIADQSKTAATFVIVVVFVMLPACLEENYLNTEKKNEVQYFSTLVSVKEIYEKSETNSIERAVSKAI